MMGCTINEAQARMTFNEFITWILYRNKYGGMNPVRKYDMSGALICSVMGKLQGKKVSVEDFLAFGKEPEQEIEVDEDAFIAALSGRSSYAKRR